MQRLKELGVSHLDALLVTHAHADHIGNALQVMKAIPTRTLLDAGFAHTTATYAALLSFVEDSPDIQYRALTRGRNISMGDHVVLEILAPEKPFLQGTRSDANANSIVFRMRVGDVTLLFTGDAEADTEERLLGAGSKGLKSDVLKVAHHGSAYATSTAFLKAVSPSVAVISAGRDNKYNHPATGTMGRIEKSGIQSWVTASDGEVEIRTDGRHYAVKAHGVVAVVAQFAGGAMPDESGAININTADARALDALPGIGPSKARAILAYRDSHGPFDSVDDLTNVKGIGQKTVERLRGFATVAGDSGSSRLPTASIVPPPAAVNAPESKGGSAQIDINRAGPDELERLPGIGPSKARAIISWRQTNGGFSRIDQLIEVKGIGPRTLEKLRSLVTLGAPPR
jgi:comEA protein